MSYIPKGNCVYGCDSLVTLGVPSHRFPHPEKRRELFNTWLSIVGDQLKETDRMKIYRSKRVCDHHFVAGHKVTGRRLKASSIPSINLHCMKQNRSTFVEADHSYSKPPREGGQSAPMMHIAVLPGRSELPVPTDTKPIPFGSFKTCFVETEKPDDSISDTEFDAGPPELPITTDTNPIPFGSFETCFLETVKPEDISDTEFDAVKSKMFHPNAPMDPESMSSQDHARPQTESSRNFDFSESSLSSSIARFRADFDNMKQKMQIFGESLNLCKCIAFDFGNKVSQLENRLKMLEKRQKYAKLQSESNYSYIIKKNKILSSKTLNEAKKLQMCGTEEEMREVAGRICRNYLHGAWKTIEPSELDFRRISGGLSNFLYYVALPEDLSKAKLRETMSVEDTHYIGGVMSRTFVGDEPKKVLLRIYGQVHGERAMDAIVTESVIFTLLSERRLGPKLHGVFSGGRIEEYIPARSLLTKELAEPALSMKIAEKMAAIHSMDIPLSKEPNWLWKTMGKWIRTVKEERLTGGVQGKNDEEAEIIKRLRSVDFDKEVEWLKKFLATVDSPVVFCHNDMQEGNILMLEDTHTEEESTYRLHSYQDDSPQKSFDPLSQYEDGNTVDSECSHISDSGEPKLVLIDFEYCAYNHRGFDIANHFQEWGYDYTNPEHPHYYENQENCPNLEQKEIFIREYLKHYNYNADVKEATSSIDEVNHLLNEVDAFALASHLFWCLWSIVNASKSQIPFGYWEYAISRLDTYIRLKQEVVKKDKFGPQKRKICEVDI